MAFLWIFLSFSFSFLWLVWFGLEEEEEVVVVDLLGSRSIGMMWFLLP